MFIASLITIAKTWKQPKCPSTDEWIKKTWSICAVRRLFMADEYYSDIEGNEIGSFVEMWMHLESAIHS